MLLQMTYAIKAEYGIEGGVASPYFFLFFLIHDTAS